MQTAESEEKNMKHYPHNTRCLIARKQTTMIMLNGTTDDTTSKHSDALIIWSRSMPKWNIYHLFPSLFSSCDVYNMLFLLFERITHMVYVSRVKKV